MKHKLTSYCGIFVLGLLFAFSTAEAQTRTISRESDEFANTVITLSPGQTLRISVINPLPAAARGEDGRKFKMLVSPLILDAHGRVIARTDEITLDPGEFRSFDFNRTDLPLPDEGPLPLRCEVRRRMFPGFAGGVQVASADLDGVIEIIDSLTGRTQVATVLRRDVELTGPAEAYQVQPGLLGLAPGQSLRVNVAHPSEGRRSQLLRARIVLKDQSGNVIAQSPELVIPPGEFRSLDFPRSALPLSGDLGTGRVQLAANIFLKFEPDHFEHVSISLELVAEGTGQMIGLPLPAVQKIRVINKCPDCESF